MTKVDYQAVERGASELPNVGFKKLEDIAVVPSKAHGEDSGFDLIASKDIIILPGETMIIPTSVAVHLGEGLDATIRPRSGITAKTKLRVQLGTIDNPYTGQLGVILDNIHQNPSTLIPVADAIANSMIAMLNVNLEKALEISEDMKISVENVVYSNELLNLKNEKIITENRYPRGTYIIKAGEKIAQLVVHPYYDKGAYITDAEKQTNRGMGGFGSTGV